jgi:hypothetical protein
MIAPVWRVDLIVQRGDHGTPAAFPTRVPAPTAMHAWAGALRKLRDHAALSGWDPDDYRVLSYRHFDRITTESEEG